MQNKQKILVYLACILLFSAVGTTLAQGQAWLDNFEGYPLGTYPSPPWYLSGNTSGAYIDNSVSFSGSQSLHLFGEIGGCWAVNAARAITVPPPFTIEFMVYNGSENIYGCHPFRGALGLSIGTNWWDCGRPLMQFTNDGRIRISRPDTVGWHYNEQEWIKVKVCYSRPSITTVHLIYWVNDSRLYEVDVPNEPCEDNLAYVVIWADEGTVWFDDVKVYTVPTGATICNAFLTAKKVNVGPGQPAKPGPGSDNRHVKHDFKIHLIPCEPMDVSVDDSAEVFVDVDKSDTYDEDERYPAAVSSTDLDGEALDIAIKVFIGEDLIDNDPCVAIYSVNNIPIEDTLGNPIDYLCLNTFTPGEKTRNVAGGEAIPEEITLLQNYPNPFNPICEIQYALPTDCQVMLSIYNTLGQKVRVLVDEHQSAGYKSVKWYGKDDNARDVASGVYFYLLQAETFTQAKKMLLLR